MVRCSKHVDNIYLLDSESNSSVKEIEAVRDGMSQVYVEEYDRMDNSFTFLSFLLTILK